ncbi:MAG: hypothetical protein LBH75_04840 [Treponema sp.]|nr:hypothetical protein [Treponema sp.]
MRNAARSDSYGHAVYVASGSKRRDTTAGEGVELDSRLSGDAGGWRDGGGGGGSTTPISNITYSSVSGGTWTLQSNDSRRSPTISHGGLTKARVSFTSTTANASITVQLEVSSESGYDYAFVSQLDNSSATSSSGYYSGSRISGTSTVVVTIPVSTPGDHFIDIGYQKDDSASSGSDCAWFTVIP